MHTRSGKICYVLPLKPFITKGKRSEDAAVDLQPTFVTQRDAIYNQPCFSESSCGGMDEGDEKRVFYRLISGMHASISSHLTAKWLLDEMLGVWGHNLPEFERRLGNPSVRDRVQNLYFAYLFVLRAVMKAAPLLETFEYRTGVDVEDALAARLMRRLVSLAD